MSLSSFSGPLYSNATTSKVLSPSDVEPFLSDLAHRFEPENEIDGILGPVVCQLLFHESLARPDGVGGGDAIWRSIIGGLEALVSVKSIAAMLTRLPEWKPEHATAASFEKVTLMGPICRLGVFGKEWESIAKVYFSEPEKQSKSDVESSNANLRNTMKSLQVGDDFLLIRYVANMHYRHPFSPFSTRLSEHLRQLAKVFCNTSRLQYP